MANRLEEKLGRECTDFDFDAQQILLERAQREVRQLKAIIWAIAWNAPGHTVSFFTPDAGNPPEQCITDIERHEADMTTLVRAKRLPSTARGSELRGDHLEDGVSDPAAKAEE